MFTPFSGELSPPSLGPQITAAMTPLLPPGSTVAVTGMNELQSGGQAKEGFGVLAETLLAGAAALAVLVFVFGSALALVPLLMAAVAIPACFLAIYGLTEITTVSVIVQYLVEPQVDCAERRPGAPLPEQVVDGLEQAPG